MPYAAEISKDELVAGLPNTAWKGVSSALHQHFDSMTEEAAWDARVVVANCLEPKNANCLAAGWLGHKSKQVVLLSAEGITGWNPNSLRPYGTPALSEVTVSRFFIGEEPSDDPDYHASLEDIQNFFVRDK